MTPNSAQQLRIGIWPGSSKSGNQFVDIYARALRDADLEVIDIMRPLHKSRDALDILHIHWPDQIFWARGRLPSDIMRTFMMLRRLRQLRARGTRIVWMVHNLDPHDQSYSRRLLWRFYKRRLCAGLDAFMTVSPGTVDTVLQAIPALQGKPYAAVWHNAYPPLPIRDDRATIRNMLGVPTAGKLFGSLGFLRPYKGIEKLILAFRQMDGTAHRLVIAGKPIDKHYLETLITLSKADDRILLIAESLDDTRYADIERACDFLILPFSKTLHSGSLIHAISTPVAAITPDTPFARALRDEVGAQWVHLYADQLRPEHLEQALLPHGTPNLAALSSEHVGQQAAAFYRKIISV